MIQIEHLSVRVGQFALEGLTLEIPTGEFGVLMGETGCGKTTIVESLCGLRKISGGRFILAGRDVTDLPPAARDIGYVPQDTALFPALSVRKHLAFPLHLRKWRRQDMDRRITELANLLSIGHLLERTIEGLSGGERQRVALGRALSWRPTTLVLDEPLSALDEPTQQRMVELLKQVQRETGVTTLHVTHSSSEAEQLAGHLFTLQDGESSRLNIRDQHNSHAVRKAPTSTPSA